MDRFNSRKKPLPRILLLPPISIPFKRWMIFCPKSNKPTAELLPPPLMKLVRVAVVVVGRRITVRLVTVIALLVVLVNDMVSMIVQLMLLPV